VAKAPTIAVVICTRDRPASLLKTLDSVWLQSRLPDELIVVDDGDLPEPVRQQAAERCQSLGITWRCLQSGRRGLTASRNLAAQVAESEVLQYLDDDATCGPAFLTEVARLMTDPAVAGVTATVEEPTLRSVGARLYQLGYRIAGWWRVRPRVRPKTPRPAVLNQPCLAAPARWLSGAAMALRRDVVRRWPFDESLAEYALGEDREMTYRLAPHGWLIESRRARVVHRRETAARTDARRLGFMTSYNYLRILQKTCRLGVGDWLLVAWGLGVVGLMHAAYALVGDRRAHLAELRGMVDGVRACHREFRGRACGAAPIRRPESRAVSSATGLAFSVRTPPFRPRRAAATAALSGVSRPRRVLFATTTLEPGGAERMLLLLLQHLPRDEIEPQVLCMKAAGSMADEFRDRLGVRVFERVLRFKTDAAAVWRIRRILRESAIDVLVVAHSGGDRMFWTTLAARSMRVPVVVWSHWFPSAADAHFELANRALYRFVDAFVALGERHRLAMIRHAHVPAGRIAVIPNAIEVSRFAEACSREDARGRLGLQAADVGVAMIANLRPEKRHDVFIEAARRLSHRDLADRRLRFFVAGDGPSREAVQAAAAASGLDGQTLQLLGKRDDVASLLPGLDVCCLCSETECFSVTMLEAAAAGCVFIAPDVGCLGEFLDNRVTGRAIRPADPASLADAIYDLAGDDGERARLAAAARDRVRQEYDAGRMVESFRALLSSMTRRDSRAYGSRRTGACW